MRAEIEWRLHGLFHLWVGVCVRSRPARRPRWGGDPWGVGPPYGVVSSPVGHWELVGSDLINLGGGGREFFRDRTGLCGGA